MAVVTGVVQAVKDGKRLQINGDWYGSFNPVGNVNAGDNVTFNWEMDKTGKYRNIKGAVSVVAGAPNPVSSGGGVAEGFTKYSATGEIEEDSPIHDEDGF